MSFRTLTHQEFGAGKVLLVCTAAPGETECGLQCHVHVQGSEFITSSIPPQTELVHSKKPTYSQKEIIESMRT